MLEEGGTQNVRIGMSAQFFHEHAQKMPLTSHALIHLMAKENTHTHTHDVHLGNVVLIECDLLFEGLDLVLSVGTV